MATVLITGASSDIGLEWARVSTRNKNNLVLVARSESKPNELAIELRQSGVEIQVLAKDLSNHKAAAEIFDWCNQHNITVHYLVNNKGLGDFGLFS